MAVSPTPDLLDPVGVFTHGEFTCYDNQDPSLLLFTHGWFPRSGGVLVPPGPPEPPRVTVVPTAPPPPLPGPQTSTIAELNYTKGTRIRVLKDNNRRGLVGLEGKVVQALANEVIVELDADPALCFRVRQQGGLAKIETPRRHFRNDEIERVPRQPGDPCGC